MTAGECYFLKAAALKEPRHFLVKIRIRCYTILNRWTDFALRRAERKNSEWLRRGKAA